MGDAVMDGFSDRGSTPLRSIKKGLTERKLCQTFLSLIWCELNSYSMKTPWVFGRGPALQWRALRTDRVGRRDGKVPVAPAMRRPSRQARLRLPSGKVISDRFSSKKVGYKLGYKNERKSLWKCGLIIDFTFYMFWNSVLKNIKSKETIFFEWFMLQ